MDPAIDIHRDLTHLHFIFHYSESSLTYANKTIYHHFTIYHNKPVETGSFNYSINPKHISRQVKCMMIIYI